MRENSLADEYKILMIPLVSLAKFGYKQYMKVKKV